MADAPKAVLWSTERGVARITLNRPDRLNASNKALSDGLTAALDAAAASADVKVVLINGAGRGFCSGADMQVLGELSADPTGPHGGSVDLRYDGFMMLPKPVIVAVHGACAGIGLALACCADIRLASANAFFLAPFAELGLCAEAGLAWLLPRLMGAGNAAEMLLSARRVPADEALAKGLVSHVFPDEGFDDAAFAYAARLAERGSPQSFGLIKGQLRDAFAQDFETARAMATVIAHRAEASADFKEAMTARREKRAPVFEPATATFDPPVSKRS